MIHYQLRCREAHHFDGWFNDSASFEKQAKLGLVECPQCGITDVDRALMAPAVSKKAALPAPLPAASAPPHDDARQRATQTPAQGGDGSMMAAGPIPAQMVAVLQRIRAEVESRCDYVGPSFAEEARRMHRGEVEPRAIYGEASDDQAESLADEGIEVARIPWVPRADG